MKYQVQESSANGWWVFYRGPLGGWRAVHHYSERKAAQEMADLLNKHWEAEVLGG